MRTFVVAGGNSGIGLQVSRNLLGGGDRVIILGRDQRKAEAALDSFGASRERAEFHSVDLSRSAGVRDAADHIRTSSDRVDGLLHSTGVIYDGDVRTAEGIPLFLAVSYLGRYHLTQLLLPHLLKSPSPRVIMMGSYMRKVPEVDVARFPEFRGLSFRQLIPQVNGAVMHYAAHLAASHERLFAGVVCPGLVKTDIFRDAPRSMRVMTAAMRPFVGNDITTAAANPTRALLEGSGRTAMYWRKAASFDDQTTVNVDPTIQQALMDASRIATGV